jgi:hypothetical protein
MSAPQPILEGKKEAPKDEERKEKISTEIEMNAHLNLSVPTPSEEELPSRDVIDTPLEEKVKIHDQSVEIALLEQKKASTTHAKKAISEKKRRERTDGKSGAQGTPVPDVLTNFSEQMNQKFDQILKALHDVQSIRALETSAQSLQEPSNIQTIQRINVPTAQPDASIPVPVSRRVREDYPEIEPADMKQQFPRESINPRDYDYFAKKFKRSNENIEFYDQDLRERAQQDPSKGQRPSSSQSQTQVFMF